MEDMKKYWWLILVVMALNFGCAAGPPIPLKKADYIQNLNMLEFGVDVKVVLDKSFVPTGHFAEDIPASLTNLKIARYVFIDESAGRDNVKRAIVIIQYQITHRAKYFKNFSFYKLPYIERGQMKLDGVDVGYQIRQLTCT